MKTLLKIFLGFFLLVVFALAGGYFYFRVSTPRDLGVTYTQEDLQSGRAKGGVILETLPANTRPEDSWQTFGSQEVKAEFSSAEITAIMNNRPGVYYPYKNVQVKFNADGSGEISGQLVKSRIPTYAATFDAPKVAVDFVMKFLPPDPVFYLKGRASLVDNNVGIFEPQKLEIGRVPIPLGPILAFNRQVIPAVYAADFSELVGEISSVSNKRQLIIDFINSRLANIQGFHAKKAYFTEDQLTYEGTLPEREATLR